MTTTTAIAGTATTIDAGSLQNLDNDRTIRTTDANLHASPLRKSHGLLYELYQKDQTATWPPCAS